MFCSTCKTSEPVRECKRKICPAGHIVCKACDINFEECPECSCQFRNLICIEVNDNTPRLFILSIEKSAEESEVEKLQNKQDLRWSQSDAESLRRMMEEMTNSEQQKAGFGDSSTQLQASPPFEYKVIAGASGSSFVIDDEEEREILKCFTVHEKSTKPPADQLSLVEVSPKTKETSVGSSKNAHRSTRREIETSTTFVVKNGADDENHRSSHRTPSKEVLSKFSLKPIRGSYQMNDGAALPSETESLFEIFRNKQIPSDSETAHFTSLAVSTTDPTPPDSPPMKDVPSFAHRVRLVAYFDDESIPNQTEPLTTYEVDSSDDDLPVGYSTKLSRFPVLCPITNCDTWSVPSDFCNHMTIDHPYIDWLKVAPGTIVNLKVNPSGNANLVACQRLFLVSDKIASIGYGTFEGCLPVALLTSRVSIRKAFGCSTPATAWKSSDENFCVWLVGAYQFPINYTLTIYTHGRDEFEPTVLKSISNALTFLNRPQTPKEIFNSALGISHQEIEKLTNGGRNLLSCQIIFH